MTVFQDELTLCDVSFERNDQFLFEQLNCTVQSGEVLQIRGMNGSGKSTLLRIIAGLLEPNTGAVLWKKQSIFQTRDSYKKYFCYMGHQLGIKQLLTPYENLAFISVLNDMQPDPFFLKNILEKMGLASVMHHKTRYLSAGQMRRVSLSKLLLCDAKIWILDEPMVALDTQGQEVLMSVIHEHLQKEGIVILATHQDLPLKAVIKMVELNG